LALLLALLISVLVPGAAVPHGGGLDTYGCHHDRKQGGYHCHRGQFAGRSFASEAEMQAGRQENYIAIPPMLPSIHFIGKVVGVTDGDTITVLHNGKGKRVRLHGIDSPEKGQAFGQRAKQFTSALVFGKEVTLMVQDSDQYGRMIGEVKLLDGRVLNHELVKAGLAWWYRRYAPGDTMLEGLEKEARDAKQGLWVDPNPIPPWTWRKLGRASGP
jgi:micrococcal nuclease